jgi:hypothetical protein
MARSRLIDSDDEDKPYTEAEWRDILHQRGYVSPYPARQEKDIGGGRKLFWVRTSAQVSAHDGKLYIKEGYLAREEPDGSSKGFFLALDLYPDNMTIKEGMLSLLEDYEERLTSAP